MGQDAIAIPAGPGAGEASGYEGDHGHRPDGLQERRDRRRAEADVVGADMLAPRDLLGGLDPDVEIIGTGKAQPQRGELGH